MNQFELLSTVFTVGVSIPLVLYFVYWVAVDSSKRYVDRRISEEN